MPTPREDLTAIIDANIRDKTVAGSLTEENEADTHEAVADYVDSSVNAMGKMYAAFITQSGAVTPSYQVNLNTTGRTWTSSLDSDGQFRLVSNIAFDVTKTDAALSNTQIGVEYTCKVLSSTVVVVKTKTGGAYDNDLINGCAIKITIYP